MRIQVSVRAAGEDDPLAIASVFASARSSYPREFVDGLDLSAADISRLMQTGHAFLVAEYEGLVVGAVRHADAEGIASFDLLASSRAGAGRALVAAVERLAQDTGTRLVRTRIPPASILEDYFARRGYVGISREPQDAAASGAGRILLEKRVPLLTVREQRRADAAAIGLLTGEDPWTFEQGARPGWFVASDGERVVGVISVRDAGGGTAALSPPILASGYGGRSLELWMVDRAAYYAETNGYHTALLPAIPGMRPHERALEDRQWFADGEHYVRRFRTPPAPEDDW